ncbi:TetR/AcrR family transcriptional regulator [Cryptosporangium phraense]|uniref:TetR/AcrR family transcriptional regulator n=1 Tax=Cryptosporangium phraense TaxID=2593070 RepID=A0A545ART6_9ACTN|nr:TetR/AcrR family transcriptional regulator [Cryptosporangium phraense]TQS44048.1 TetR/AcrR family transcriptional regulator [Cryptosporangium phraense]
MSTNRAGRPRARGSQDSGRTPRQEILDAAAALFGESGFAATSTRAIAERVGVRQASLYYYFPGKDEILLELLEASVRPTLDLVDAIRAAAPSAAGALYALAVRDVGTLQAGPLGVATLYMAPEVRTAPAFASFRAHRAQLLTTYSELAGAASATAPAGADVLGSACLHVVEMVTTLAPRPGLADEIARTCLGIAGLTGPAAADAAADGAALLAALTPAATPV